MGPHWDSVYQGQETETLGWYEATPTPSLEMIERCQLDPTDAILDVGAGSSTLFDHLLSRGYKNLIAVDLSLEALNRLELRIAESHPNHLHCIVDDITHPTELIKLQPVKLWHDRALLHFLHDQVDKQSYLSTLCRLLLPDGYVIIAAFSLNGAEQCTGLPVHRYNAEMLAEFLGPEFSLREQFDHTYHQPSGNPRPFIYTRFQRTG
jgi:ubiquinone/menaquinone biosynthesis C-methylase UbiE